MEYTLNQAREQRGRLDEPGLTYRPIGGRFVPIGTFVMKPFSHALFPIAALVISGALTTVPARAKNDPCCTPPASGFNPPAAYVDPNPYDNHWGDFGWTGASVSAAAKPAILTGAQVKLSALVDLKGKTFAIRASEAAQIASRDFVPYSRVVRDELLKKGMVLAPEGKANPDYIVWIGWETKAPKAYFSLVVSDASLGGGSRIVYKGASATQLPSAKSENVIPHTILVLMDRFPDKTGDRWLVQSSSL